MFRLLWNLSIRVRLFLRTYMPTNILLDALRTRRGLKWGVPAMLIAAPYLFGAWLLTVWIAAGVCSLFGLWIGDAVFALRARSEENMVGTGLFGTDEVG